MTDSSLAFVFPGQGSQKVGMLSDIAEQYPLIGETFAEASHVLDYDLWGLIQNGEQEQLNLTERTQPILLTASVALWRVWQQQGGAQAASLAGHSLGEFSALVCAGSLQFADAVDLVKCRGQYMQTAVPVGEGAMAAVLGLDDAVIEDICRQTGAEAVNYNSPGQVVIAGKVGAVEQAIEQLKEAGAKRAMPLPVSAPFHTSLMRPAGDQLEQKLQSIDVSAPLIPVIHNVHAETESDPVKIKQLLVRQIYSPVKWTSCVQAMVAGGIDKTLECGPGKVLSGLSKRIDRSLTSLYIETPDSFNAALADLS